MHFSKPTFLWIGLALLVLAAITVPSLQRHSGIRPEPTAQQLASLTVQDQLASQLEKDRTQPMNYLATPPSSADPDQKVIRTAELALVVTNVGEAAAKLRSLIQHSHGEIDQSREWSPYEGSREGELHVRVPAVDLDDVLQQLKGVAARVTSEQVSASDVTRQYADNAAHMRSLKAEEQQYLVILKRANSVKDILEVTEKLNEVRGQIEQLQTDINVMSHDVAMSAIAITLTQNAPEAHLFGTWHPMLNARRTLRNMLASLGEWLDAMVSLVIFLPVLLLWGLTIGGVVWIAWRIVRLFRRRRVSVRTAV